VEHHDPDVNDLLFMHAALVKQYGGSSGVRDAGALEAAVARPWGSSSGEEHFPTPFLKAAALCESVIKRHPFVDGNKRTGVAAGTYLLSTLGHRLAVQRGHVEDFAVAVATGTLTLEQMASWFRDNSSEI
jgi:death-on-curing protein